MTPGIPSSDATRTAAVNSRRPRSRSSESRWFGAISSTVAPIERNRSSLARPWRSSDARRPATTPPGSATSSAPSCRKRARSTSSNPSSFTIPIRASCPATAGKEYSLQETRAAVTSGSDARPRRGGADEAGVLREDAGRVARRRVLARVASRDAISPSGSSTCKRFASASISTTSPSPRIASGPPSAASGEMCPTEMPCVPPPNRPSVSSATLSTSPAPTIAAVRCVISGIPGPPFGPSYRSTTTSPGWMRPSATARNASCSPLNTFAGPRWRLPSWFATLITAPSGARLPQRIA